MRFLGFGENWSTWISYLLVLARSLVINGSPSKEFMLERGLRHKDSPYPFLFILVMERLHVETKDVVNVYANDVLLIR